MVGNGDLGQLRVGYQQAALFRSWRLTTDEEVLRAVAQTIVDAKVSNVDLYWCTQNPLDLGLWMGSSWWVWKGVSVIDPIKVGGPIKIVAQGVPQAQLHF